MKDDKNAIDLILSISIASSVLTEILSSDKRKMCNPDKLHILLRPI